MASRSELKGAVASTFMMAINGCSSNSNFSDNPESTLEVAPEPVQGNVSAKGWRPFKEKPQGVGVRLKVRSCVEKPQGVGVRLKVRSCVSGASPSENAVIIRKVLSNTPKEMDALFAKIQSNVVEAENERRFSYKSLQAICPKQIKEEMVNPSIQFYTFDDFVTKMGRLGSSDEKLGETIETALKKFYEPGISKDGFLGYQKNSFFKDRRYPATISMTRNDDKRLASIFFKFDSGKIRSTTFKLDEHPECDLMISDFLPGLLKKGSQMFMEVNGIQALEEDQPVPNSTQKPQDEESADSGVEDAQYEVDSASVVEDEGEL